MTSAEAGAPPGPPTAASLRRAARGSILNAAGAGLAAVATFALTVVVTRSTDQADAGTFFTVTAIFMLAMGLSQLGTNAGLVYFLSGARAQHDVRTAGAYMEVASRPALTASLVLAVAILLLAHPLGSAIGETDASRFVMFVAPVAVFLPFATVFNLAMSATRGLGTMKVFASVDQVARPVLQLLLVTLALVLVGVELAPWAWTGVYLPIALVGWVWWRALARRHGIPRGTGERPWRSFWRFSSPRALVSLAQIAMQRLDIILVSVLAGLAEAAVYAAVSRFIALGSVAARAVGLSAQPLLRERLVTGDDNAAQLLYQISTAWLVLITWPLYLSLIVFGPTVLIVFGDGYEAGAGALALLAAAMLVATACGTVDSVLMMAGKSGWTLVNVLIAFGVTLGLDLVLIPEVGVLGAAIGWGCGIVVVNLLPLAQLVRWRRLHPMGRTSLAAACLVVAAFGAIPLAVRLAFGGGPLVALLGLTLGLLAYAVGLWTWRDRLHLGYFRDAFRRRRTRVATVRGDEAVEVS